MTSVNLQSTYNIHMKDSMTSSMERSPWIKALASSRTHITARAAHTHTHEHTQKHAHAQIDTYGTKERSHILEDVNQQ